MDDILKHLLDESNELIDQLLEILERIEADPLRGAELATFAQIVDRIMGGAAVAALDLPAGHAMHKIAKFAELCKYIGYKAAKIDGNPGLTTVVTAFLLDATETLKMLVTPTETGEIRDINEVVTKTFLERLQLLSGKLDATVGNIATTHESARSSQAEIDALLKSMGLDN